MERIKVAVVGLGNVGHAAAALVESAPDMELASIVRRRLTGEEPPGSRVVTEVAELPEVDVALLCIPTLTVSQQARTFLEAGINTVDSFDLHGKDLVNLRNVLGVAARRGDAVAVLAAGWDPGSDSVVRTLFEAIAPRGVSYTSFGPGMSMGHSVAARSVPGVADAVALTLPLGYGRHKREVYVRLQPGAEPDAVRQLIQEHRYFTHDETRVVFVDDVESVRRAGHQVSLTRYGAAGSAQNQCLNLTMTIDNPFTTAQIMVAAGRASVRQAPGAYTLVEIPPVDLLPGTRETWIERLT